MASNQIDNSQYLTFKLDDEIFALPIAKVKEVLEYTTPTRIPRLPKFIKGVLNIRGDVVPLIDLREQFSLPPAKITLDSAIIIVELEIDESHISFGGLADAVQEVIQIPEESLLAPPKIHDKIDISFVKGMGRIGEQFIIVLDIDKVFLTDELMELDLHSPENSNINEKTGAPIVLEET